MKKLLFILLAVVAIATSCEKGGDVVAPIDVQLMGEDIDLMDCRYYEQAHRISIITEGAWELVCSEEWMSSRTPKGVGADTVYVVLSENTTALAREGSFKVVNAAGGSSESFKVKQGSVADMDDNSSDDVIETYGFLFKNGVCEIYTAAGFEYFRNMDEDVHAILMNDIDLSGIANWTPMFQDDAFEGHFYGDHHTIKNLTINSDEDYVGFFAELGDGACIYDLHFENVDVRGYGDHTGVLAGDLYADSGSDVACIHNCSVLSGKIVGKFNVGGLVGRCDYGLFTYCANYASVKGFTDELKIRVGGIVGESYATSAMVACYNIGDIYGESTAIPGEKISQICLGGIVGYADHTYRYTYVRGCYSAGNIIGVGEWESRAIAGGIAGYEQGSVRRELMVFDCFYDNASSAFGDADDVCYSDGDEWRFAYKREGAMNEQTTVDELNNAIRSMKYTDSDYDYVGAHNVLRSMSGLFKVGDKGHPVFDENVKL